LGVNQIKVTWERIAPWSYIVDNVASEYHKKFDVCDIEDIRQELLAWFLQHPRKFAEWENLAEKDTKNLLYRSLRNRALDYCQYWKSKSLGYEYDDLFFYTPEMVETLLPSVLLGHTDALPLNILGKSKTTTLVSEGNNLQVMLAEISKICVGLSAPDQQVLQMRFALGYEYSDISKLLELNTEEAARQRVRRAVKRIINALGGYRPQIDEDSPSEETDITPDEEPSYEELV